MFVIEKENGKNIVRPAYIGYIKNNWVRRTLGILVLPLTILITISINLLFSGLWLIGNIVTLSLRFIYGVITNIIVPLSGCYKDFGRFWNHPRTNNK